MLRVAKTQAIWQPRKSRGSEAELARQQIFAALKRAMMARSLLEVRLQGDDGLYQSLILELDSDEGTILIDELFPGTYEAVPGQWLDINVRQAGGRSLRFGATILQSHLYDDAPIYVISMPEDLDQEQRRGAFRLPIDDGIVVESHFTGPDRQHYTGQLCNISSSGLCIAPDSNDIIELNFDDVLQDIVFDYGGMEIECDARVRNILNDEETRAPIRVGAQFQHMSSAERRQLERLILKMQRRQLRNRDEQRESLFH